MAETNTHSAHIKSSQTIACQDLFYEKVIGSSASVSIYLLSGIRMLGTITRAGRYEVTLTREGVRSQIQKSAITTIMPMAQKR